MNRLLLKIFLFGFFVFLGWSPVAAKELQIITEQEVRKEVEAFILSKAASPEVEVKIRHIGYRGDLSLPVGTVEYEMKAPQQWEGWGNANLAIIVRVNGRVLKNVPVRVEVEALTDIVVTTRQLNPGDIISESDIVVQKRDIAQVGNKICKNPAEVVGKRLKSPLRGNVPVRSDQLEKLPLIKSGQLVTIILDNSLVRVTATGRSKGTGAAGESIMVQNLASQKDIPARVIDSSTVRVEF
jgi:flagella basal body P-ring formation protein FlgA